MKGWPLGLHTSGQTPKVKGLQSAYMAALLAPRIWPLGKNLDPLRMETQIWVERWSFFSIKYSKSNKRILIIYFNGLLASPLTMNLGNDLLAWPAKCKEPMRLRWSKWLNLFLATRIICKVEQNYYFFSLFVSRVWQNFFFLVWQQKWAFLEFSDKLKQVRKMSA